MGGRHTPLCSQRKSGLYIIHTGDICYEPGIRFHADSVNTSTMGVPVYYVMGNHDLMKKKVTKPEYLYEECLGPAWYSFEASGVHFIVVPMLIGDGRPYIYCRTDLCLAQNDLAQTAPGQRIVVFTHYENTLSGNELVFKSKRRKNRFQRLQYPRCFDRALAYKLPSEHTGWSALHSDVSGQQRRC